MNDKIAIEISKEDVSTIITWAKYAESNWNFFDYEYELLEWLMEIYEEMKYE